MKRLHPSQLVSTLVPMAAVSLLAGCGSGTVPTTVATVTTTQTAVRTTTAGREVQRNTDVTFMTREDGLVPAGVEIYAPEEEGPWPVLVMLHGGGAPLSYLTVWATDAAERGAVLFVPEWARSYVISEYSPEELRAIFSGEIGDVAAAVRFARATAQQYGSSSGDAVMAPWPSCFWDPPPNTLLGGLGCLSWWRTSPFR